MLNPRDSRSGRALRRWQDIHLAVFFGSAFCLVAADVTFSAILAHFPAIAALVSDSLCLKTSNKGLYARTEFLEKLHKFRIAPT